ncbi:unnamed protein product [Bursaphelenchus okinawaensis]|uniref:Uncharacterized protein n=1 Tax=Bursaphelenchus okinawaensis TaxID=465554 RepID=A0A811JVB1_9BILA|nr:unnamed protein product [Bursaphelenchus okinawaensis]CAG9084625.1 unnamed protein product [Bursaphelenchus okinawaensis]
MNTFASKSGFCPSVAVLSSQGAENVAYRNKLSFAQMLGPFSTIKAEIKDPNGRSGQITLTVDFRDIRKDGYLLSLSVLPSVLQEIVKLNSNNSSSDVWDNCFVQAFHSWFEPAEHDFLKAHLACIFVISAEDQNPLGELENLVNQQNLQQHGSDAGSLQIPAFCSSPKWFLPQTLKYYVVLHDVLKGNKENAERIYKSVKDKYGDNFSALLEINSEQEVNLPDLWSNVNVRRIGLRNGLDVARREILASRSPNPNSNGIAIDQEKPQVEVCSFGKCLSQEDRDRIKSFVEHFINMTLIGYVTKQMQLLNDAIVSRRGIGKSFTSMRKWLNVATASPTTNSTSVNYTTESTEMQSRRLADLAFLFGAYPFAFQLYQSLKKDFLNDQAWLQHAGTLEMAAITSYLSGASNAKNFPMHYIENSLNYYLKTSLNPLLFFRSLLFSTRLLEALDRPQDAAGFLARFIPQTNLTDLFKAVAIEHSGTLFGRARMFRKQSFHRFLASKCFYQIKLDTIATRLLESVLTEISDKRWSAAEDHLLEEMCRELGNDKEMVKECLEKLLKSDGSERTEGQSIINFVNYLKVCEGMDSVALTIPELEPKSTLMYYVNQDVISRNGKESWMELYNQSIAKMRHYNPAVKQPFGAPKVLKVPTNEPVYVKIGLVNKYAFPVLMEKVKLEVKSNAEVECHIVERIEIPAYDNEKEGNITEVLLAFTPKSVDNMYEVTSMSCRLSDLNKTAVINGVIAVEGSEKSSKICVKTDKLVWPRLDISLPPHSYDEHHKIPLQLYCGQVYSSELAIQNKSESAANVLITSDCANEFGIAVDGRGGYSSGLGHGADQGAGHGLHYGLGVSSQGVRFGGQGAEHSLHIGSVQGSGHGVYQATDYSSHQASAQLRSQDPEGYQEHFQILPGQNTTLNLLIFVSTTKVVEKLIKVMITYSSAHGAVRNHLIEFIITSEMLLHSSIRVVDKKSGLCGLVVRNEAPVTKTFSNIEVLKLSIKSNEKRIEEVIGLEKLSNRSVMLETDQQDTFCFKVKVNMGREGETDVVVGKKLGVEGGNGKRLGTDGVTGIKMASEGATIGYGSRESTPEARGSVESLKSSSAASESARSPSEAARGSKSNSGATGASKSTSDATVSKSSSLSLEPSIVFKEIPSFISRWPNHKDQTNSTVIYFELLWKARVTCEQGTTTTLYGRSRIPNPFITIDNEERNDITTFICPKTLLKKSLEEKKGAIDGLEKVLKLSEEDIDTLASEFACNITVKDPRIPWESKYAVA